jgi:hypothetical protein
MQRRIHKYHNSFVGLRCSTVSICWGSVLGLERTLACTSAPAVLCWGQCVVRVRLRGTQPYALLKISPMRKNTAVQFKTLDSMSWLVAFPVGPMYYLVEDQTMPAVYNPEYDKQAGSGSRRCGQVLSGDKEAICMLSMCDRREMRSQAITAATWTTCTTFIFNAPREDIHLEVPISSRAYT